MTKQRYIVIQEWMLSLDLNLNELIAYALIYGFCQDRDSDFHGSIDYVAYWCRVGRRQAIRILNALVAKGVVSKEEVPGHVCRYRVTHLPPVADMPPVTSMSPQGCHPALQGVTPMSPNNIDDMPEDKIDTHTLKEQPEKIKFGQRLEMTQKQYDSILAKYGPTDTPLLIQLLDDYLINHPTKKVLDAPAAIRNWVVDKLNQRKIDEQRLKNAQEAGQRVNAQQQKPQGPPPGNYAALADANRRFKEITDKYKN